MWARVVRLSTHWVRKALYYALRKATYQIHG
jgi:hypothetical protein